MTSARIEVPTLGDPACRDCHGSGYQAGHEKDARGRRFSWWRQCACVDARRPSAEEVAERELMAALRHAGLPDPQATLAREIWWGMEGREEMGRGVRAFVERILAGGSGGTVVLAGPLGIGKTILQEWAVAELVQAGRRALYVSKLSLSEAVQARIDHEDWGHSYLQRVQGAEIVMFDQMDWAEDASPITKEVVRDIFDQRYKERRTKATLFAVNLTAWDGEKTGVLSPLYNRMLEAEIYRVTIKGVRASLAGRDDPAERRETA